MLYQVIFMYIHMYTYIWLDKFSPTKCSSFWHSHYCSFSSLGSWIKHHFLRGSTSNHPIQKMESSSIRVVLKVCLGIPRVFKVFARSQWGQNCFHNNTKSFFVLFFPSFPDEYTVEFSRGCMIGAYISLMATNGMSAWLFLCIKFFSSFISDTVNSDRYNPH